MADQHPDLALPKLLELIHDPDPQVYRTAVKGIGVVGHSALPDLLQLFDSSDSGTVEPVASRHSFRLLSISDQLFSSTSSMSWRKHSMTPVQLLLNLH